MKPPAFLPVVLLLAMASSSAALEFDVSPVAPTRADAIRITLRGGTQGGVLHWGVNARRNNWTAALPAYRPLGSVLDGVATRTPLQGPDESGAYVVALGPFSDTNQPVGTIDFVVQWDDGTWDTAGGEDYHIPVSSARIDVEPSQPSLNDPVRIVVRRSAPGGLLRWGVNASLSRWSPPHALFQPAGTVPSDDGLAVDTPLPPPDAAGNSVLVLGPFHEAAQVVTSLHMAVHWGDEWDTDLGRNYNVSIAEAPAGDGPRLRFVEPEDGAGFTGAPPFRVESACAPITLWLDGRPVVSLIREPFEWRTGRPLAFGRHEITARCESNGNAALARAEFWITPPFRAAAFPADGIRGASENAGGEVTFALHAPGKHFVSLVGDFNRWDPAADVMNLSPDGTWWLTKNLPNGRTLYQYAVDGSLFLADPYSKDVEWTDPEGKETHVPALARTVLTVGAPPFRWTDEEFRRPPLDALAIYEFFIADLCPGEGFTGVTARLDAIRELGVNAIEPLPWNEFTGAISWGYNPSFHFAPETAYGTPDELRQLINEAHGRGMAVIMDMVLNHMDWQSPLCQLYGLDYAASPYFHLFLGENWGFPDLDQESPAFKAYVADLLRFWVEEYHVDGFRYDATRWVGWEGYNDWGAGWFAYAGKRADTGVYQIAEHIPADPELVNGTEMDTGWDAHFRWRLREMLRDGSLHREEFARIMNPAVQGFRRGVQRVVYTESHDEERVMREMEEAGWSAEASVRRSVAALAVTLTAPGVAMIYAGQEFGENTPKVVGLNPLRGPRRGERPFDDLHENARALLRLRTTHPALRTDSLRIVEDLPDDVAVYERLVDESGVIVAVNFGRDVREVDLLLPRGRGWSDVLVPAASPVPEGGAVRLLLPPGGAVVYTDQTPR